MADRPPDASTLPPQTIGFTSNPEATLPPGPTTADDAMPECAGRIELRGELARGGMGAVLRGHDPALNREVAVKVLLSSFAGRPDLVRRFVDEAQVAGQLQHPGVVPIYDLGTVADGRPFFAMKLVHGRTLAELLAARPTVAHDLPQFLKIFEAVCQAVAFAHSHRIIHRDLKPLNVMVGAFGEVQVMDWGIAKVLGDERSEQPSEAELAVSAREPSALTSAGSTLGTLAYMPPEQAAGEPVDERADVFGLGAMLCEILTGQPPYVGTAEHVLWKAVGADLADAFARLDASGADAELIGTAKNCLAANRAERPPDAAAVAAAVSAYLAGVQERLRRAELERAAAETQAAEEHKRRRVQLALAATILITILGGAAVGFWVQRERAAQAAETAQQQADAEQRVAVAVQKAKLLDSQGQPAAALAAAEQARELTADGRVTAATREQVAALTENLRIVAEQAERDRLLIERLQDASDVAENSIAPFAGDSTSQHEYLVYHYQYIFRFWDTDIGTMKDDDVVQRMRARPAAVRRELAAGLDQWAWHARVRQRPAELWRRLIRLAASVDPDADPIRADLRAIAERDLLPADGANRDLSRLRGLADRADPAIAHPQTLVFLAAELQAAGDADRAIELLKTAMRTRPGEVLVYERLAHTLLEQSPPRWAEAIPYLQSARALRPRLAARLAMALVHVGRVDEALAVCKAAEHTRPDPATPYLRVAQVLLLDQKRLDMALPFFQAAGRLAPNDRNVHLQLGAAYENRGEYAAAERELQLAINLPLFVGDASRAALDKQIATSAQRLLDSIRRLVAIEGRLDGVLAGRETVTPQDRCDLATICIQRKRWRDAIRLFAEAFAEDPRLMEPVNSARYNAACAALLAAADQFAAKPNDTESARLRRQALDWLRAELTAIERRLNTGKASDRAEVERLMRHWHSDADLASVRDEPARSQLPPDERDAWTKLWTDAGDLLKRAGAE